MFILAGLGTSVDVGCCLLDGDGSIYLAHKHEERLIRLNAQHLSGVMITMIEAHALHWAEGVCLERTQPHLVVCAE